MSIIYRATNKINNKSYIGFTTRSLDVRKSEHLTRNETILHKAIKKYGAANFEWTEIYHSWDDDHCLSVAEPLLIAEYDTMRNGYNMTPGGEMPPSVPWNKGMTGVQVHSEETRKRIGEAQIDRQFSTETREKIGLANSRRVHSVESRRKMSEARRGRVLSDDVRRKISAGIISSLAARRATV